MANTDSSLLPELNATLESDRAHLWHPYTQAKTAPSPESIVRAEGALLYKEDGTAVIDAMSSWWVTLHGHGNPYIAESIAEQARTLEHVMLAGFTHHPAAHLAERLAGILPGDLNRVFYSDNGTTAVETALKIAFQYHYNQNPETKRTQIIVLEGGFYGESIASMSCSDRSLFSKPFAPLLFDVHTIPAPSKGNEEHSLEALKAILAENTAACFIFEPLVQAVSGMRFHTAEGLSALIECCAEQGVLTIADEVFTGFGRLGPLFASEELSMTPDFICLAKPLTGGFLPLGATVTSEKVYSAFLSDDRSKALLHGHSYTGNPVCCAAAHANLDILLSDESVKRRKSIEEQHQSFLKDIQGHPAIADCRSKGTLLVIDFKSEEHSYYSPLRDRLAAHFREHGVLIRPFGNMIHVLPPYCISEQELEVVYRSILSSLEIFE